MLALILLVKTSTAQVLLKDQQKNTNLNFKTVLVKQKKYLKINNFNFYLERKVLL